MTQATKLTAAQLETQAAVAPLIESLINEVRDLKQTVSDLQGAKLLSADEAAKAMGYNVDVLRRKARKGEIPCTRHGAKYLFNPKDLVQKAS